MIEEIWYISYREVGSVLFFSPCFSKITIFSFRISIFILHSLLCNSPFPSSPFVLFFSNFYIPRILYSFCHSYCRQWQRRSWECGCFIFIDACLMKCFSVNKTSVCAGYFISAGFSACSNLVGLSLHWTISHTQQRGFTLRIPNKAKITCEQDVSVFCLNLLNDVIAMHAALCKSLKYAFLSTDLRG